MHVGFLACWRKLRVQEWLRCCNADALDCSTETAADTGKPAMPKEAPRPRGLWGPSPQVAPQVADSGTGRDEAQGAPCRQAVEAEPDQAACKGTSLVGSGVSMSALSAAFQV